MKEAVVGPKLDVSRQLGLRLPGVLDHMCGVIAVHGAASSVNALIKGSGVSRKTFYTIFRNRLGALRVAVEHAAQGVEAAEGPLAARAIYLETLARAPEIDLELYHGVVGTITVVHAVNPLALEGALAIIRTHRQRGWQLTADIHAELEGFLALYQADA